MSRRITIPYKPRPAFSAYHDSDKRFSVSVCHRRAGKTVARINRLIRAAATTTRSYPPGRYGYIAPFRKQAKEIAWLYLCHYAAPLVALGGKINQTELTLTLHNGASIALYGAENAEAMRGLYFDGIVMDEAQGISKSVITQIVLPCLADYQGWLDVSGTPRGWANTLGEIFRLASDKNDPIGGPDNWFLQVLKASQSGILPADELARQRRLMSENEYDQEFECSFDAAITGAVYGKWIADCAEQGRITDIRPVPGVEVSTAWDLGYDDATAIWWFQVLPGKVLFLDYFEENHQEIGFYCQILKDRAKSCGYTYGRHYAPHDAGYELQAAGGRSMVQQAWEAGIKLYVVPSTSQQNSIEALRLTLRNSYFDQTKCAQGLEALRQYQFEYDDDKKVYRSKPRHDWASHGADAAEIVGRVWREPIAEAVKEGPRFLDQARAEELFDLQGAFSKVISHRERRI